MEDSLSGQSGKIAVRNMTDKTLVSVELSTNDAKIQISFKKEVLLRLISKVCK